jgi:hypothetical protein
MQTVKIGDDYVVINYLQGDALPVLEHDDIIDTADNPEHRTVIITGNGEKMANDEMFLSLLGLEEYPNITASPELLSQIRPENFKYLRKQLIIDEFSNIIGNTSNTDRLAAATDAIKDKLGIESVEPSERNTITIVVDGVKRVGTVKYGRIEGDELQLTFDLKFIDKIPTEITVTRAHPQARVFTAADYALYNEATPVPFSGGPYIYEGVGKYNGKNAKVSVILSDVNNSNEITTQAIVTLVEDDAWEFYYTRNGLPLDHASSEKEIESVVDCEIVAFNSLVTGIEVGEHDLKTLFRTHGYTNEGYFLA